MFYYGIILFYYLIILLTLSPGRERPAALADKKSLHYTTAVVHEVMRIRPVAAMALPHATTCDTKLGKGHKMNNHYLARVYIVMIFELGYYLHGV